MTVRRDMQDALVESHLALERSYAHIRFLAGQLVAAQEDERRRISLELHDAVSQRIAAACVTLEELRSHLPEHAATRLGDVVGVLSDVAAGVRHLSHAMHPPVLEVAGLAAALRGHCAELRRLALLDVEVAAEDLPAIGREAALCLYRVAQEALGNVAAHSGVRRARLSVAAGAGRVELEVRDAGCGFDVATVQAGLGLTGMHERVRLLRGTFAVETGPGRGTVVRVQVPLDPPAAGAKPPASEPATHRKRGHKGPRPTLGSR